MRILADRLISSETQGDVSEQSPPTIFVVCEKLRPPLATLMGSAGFRALLARALAMSAADIPWLRTVSVLPNGTLAGLETSVEKITPHDIAEGRAALVTNLLTLLDTFIGENLTVRLVSEVWPKLRLPDSNTGPGDKNEKTK